MQHIPFSSVPDQTFTTTLDGESVRLRVFWAENSRSWFMDVDGVSFDFSAKGLRLCTNIGTLAGYAVREIGDFVVVDLEDKLEDPNYAGMGSRWVLVYLTIEELGYDTV